MFLLGDNNGIIKQWKIEADNLVLISKKENANNNSVYALIKLRDEHVVSCSFDKSIKIW